MARPSRRLGNLPAEATSFIGRRREMAELKKKLSQARLVSLIGPGGVGKSRLAIRIGSELARGFPDGVWLVELAEIRDASLINNAALAALDLRDQAGAEPRAMLLSYLKDRKLLLLVDNCEHLLEAAAGLVADIVRTAPGVRVVATSREPLSIDGEHVVPVPPLDLPPADAVEDLAPLQQNEAVMLYSDRAAAASGSFELDPANGAAVIAICRRLDGLPLAIELAAVRTRSLSVQQIRDRLNDRFSLLTGGSRAALPRHQTLRTTIDWSYDLLPANERTLLRRLCVFAGRFTLEDVEGACGEPGQAFELLSSLVDKSLVIKEELRGRACYRLHETMREYAVLKLKDAGEVEEIGERCTAYYWARCGGWVGDVRFRLAEWLDWMDIEIDNVRAVLGHCLGQRDVVRGMDLVTSVAWYWITRATTEGTHWLDEFLALGRGNPEAQFWAYFLRGFLAVLKADAVAAPPVLAKALATAHELGQPSFVSQALSMASIAANYVGDQDASRRYFEQAAEVTAGLDEYLAQISLLQARALNAFFAGDVEAVRSASTDGIRLSRAANDLYALEMMLVNRGGTAMMAGEIEPARGFYADALTIAQRLDDRVAGYALLDSIGCAAAAQGQARLAAQLLGAGETVRTQAGADLIPILAPMISQAREAATAALGNARFEAEFAAGKRLGRDEAIRLALGQPRQSAPAVHANGDAALLAKRETDVARLVAEGLSNKEIGARLFISERTVDSHVRSILNKLGFNSRAQIAHWVASGSR